MAIVGIDLGTTNSGVAMVWMGRPEILPNAHGQRTTPSVVGMSEAMGMVVGHKAKYQRVPLLSPPIANIKRQMGQETTVVLGKEQYSPTQISSLILRKIVEDAEEFLQESIGCAVITIPAYFNEAARRATRKAGELAGLHVGMILDEPTAAALAYGVGGDKAETICIYDLGGGTFDISIIEIHDHHFEVLAIDGDQWLGGRDFDEILTKYVIDEAKSLYGVDFSADREVLARIEVAVELAKCDLSRQRDASVIIEAATPEVDINIDIKRELLEELIRSRVEETLAPIERALEKADLEIDEIDHVLLVGGSTRIPLVRQTVERFFEKQPRIDLHPDECVALGAASYTTLLDEDTIRKYSSGDKASLRRQFVVVPRTAHSLGIGADEGGTRLSVILPANTFYPVSVTRKNYFTAVDGQKGLEVWVYEGENPIAQKNTPLGRILLDFPPGLASGTSIWITFSLNASRILEITVQLPEYPERQVQVKIDTARSSDSGDPHINQWKRQIDTVESLWNAHRHKLPQSKSAEIMWALNAAKEALTGGNPETIAQKVYILDHIREFLTSLAAK